ncbi:MAG TPA: heme exporter protein CcmB [Bacteroidia bacterium]|nr:heme exporter protein CcmB [Bacteroidia bacterium]
MIQEIKALIQKEFLIEWRQRYALAGIILYVVATVFISYLSFKNIIEVSVWNALFWTIVLFASINASAKSFLSESQGRLLYYYTLVSPQVFILSKIIYNGFLMLVLSLICFAFYSLFMGNIIPNIPLFLLIVVLGSLGLSSLLSMMSAIAAKAQNNFTIMAILAFPIIMPLLIVIIRLSMSVINGMDFYYNLKFFAVLFLLDIIIIILAYLLFPYLWKD